MIPTPSEALIKELNKPKGLRLFPYDRKQHCARVNRLNPSEMVVSIWDISQLDDMLADVDPESSSAPPECGNLFPAWWNRVAHYKTTKTSETAWSDWIIVQGSEDTSSDAMGAFLEAFHTL